MIPFSLVSTKTFAQLLMLLIIHADCSAQTLAGEWRGTISIQGTELPIVFHVTRDGEKYQSTLDSPNQNAFGIKVSETILANDKVTFKISTLNAVYEGILAGKKMTGVWMQSGQSLPLLMTQQR
jgi:hypothetical protein